ncbi:MAG: hypothetical protein QOG15_1681 [Solirubrobacteraceae bacterium]|jgi:hypothetical protein|nr:hypothetical protein [Solirubrobacteraceae bacterium]
MRRVNAMSDLFRAQAATHRAAAQERPDDPRFVRSAEALENLADYAERAAEEGLFQMRYLLDHHIADGRFAWPEGQSGRAVARYGFDQPVHDAMEHEMFLMDLCDLAKIDASRHVGTPANGYERDDAPEIAKRFGMSVEQVHRSLDTGRGYAHLFAVGIPAWHELGDRARAQLEAMDGVFLMPGRREQFPDEDEPPLLACNIVADDDAHARAIVGKTVGIDPDALGVNRTERLLR